MNTTDLDILPFTTVQEVLSTFGLPVLCNKANVVCAACQMGKSNKLSFSLSTSSSKGPLDLLYSDACGLAPIPSIDGHRYYVHFHDDFTKFRWIFPLYNESKVLVIFKKFKALVENLFDRKIKNLALVLKSKMGLP